MKHPTYPLQNLQHQRGATLLVTLIMLILMLMLAVTGMRSITVETRIAAHMLEARQLFEVADGALRDGERALAGGDWIGAKVEQCAAGAPPLDATGTPCWITDATADANTSWEQVAQANGFAQPQGYWYPRYIRADCPGPNGGLKAPGPSCIVYYEINAQATHKNGAQACGTDALCLRSSIKNIIE